MENEFNNLNQNEDFEKEDTEKENYEKVVKKNNELRVTNMVLSIFTVFFGLIILLIVLISILIFTKFGSRFNILANKMYNQNVATNSTATSLDTNRIIEKLNFIDAYVDTFYYYDKDNTKIEDEIFTGYMKALNDKYGEYMSPKRYDNFVEDTSGEYYGIGAVVSTNNKNNEFEVQEIYPNSPAEKAGMLAKDILKAVNGKDITQLTLSDVVDKIKGPEGTDVTITIYRPSEDKNIDLVCTRGKVEQIRVSNEVIDYDIGHDVGYITITEFTGKTLEQFKKTIDELENKKVNGLIIDLRNNPGGELTVVLDMLDYVLRDHDGRFTLNTDDFVSGSTLLVYMRDRTSIIDAYYCNDNNEVDLPIVILTNGNSASASELFTRTLQAYGKAIVVGEKTYGKGVMQNIQPLPDGSAIRLTVAGYFPPDGYKIDGVGVVPDIPIDMEGGELKYNADADEIYVDNDGNYKILKYDGKEVSTTKTATNSVAVRSENFDKNIDLVIYSDSFKYSNSDWYEKLDDKYNDKQLVQAIVLLNDNK